MTKPFISWAEINSVRNRRTVYRAYIYGTSELIVVKGKYKIFQLQLPKNQKIKMQNRLDKLFTWLIREYGSSMCVDETINLFKRWEYNVDVTDHHIYKRITTIDIGDIDSFIEFLDKQKQLCGADTMPTKTELLQFLSKGDD